MIVKKLDNTQGPKKEDCVS